MAPRCGFTQNKPGQGIQKQHGDGAQTEFGAAHFESVAQESHGRRQVGDGLRLGINLGHGKGNVQRAQRDNEWWQLDACHQQAIEQAKSGGHQQPEEDGQISVHAVVDGKLGHDHATQGHHHAARQVNAGGQDDQRLADGDHAHHHHLL
ncbi:hypothetical protein GALL_446880 [mine drainage metagenome]|uniref:Uncharacterized protein n=1 Tax=mine drainage metagenome TaxID=410659 RepID=A0A1J5Q0W9_9ZZZZ